MPISPLAGQPAESASLIDPARLIGDYYAIHPDPGVAALFVEMDANHWKSKATGYILQDGFLNNYKANGQMSLDYLGDVVYHEEQLGSGKVMQRYAKGVRLDDNNAYSSLSLYEGAAVDPMVGKLEAQLRNQPAAPQSTAQLLQFAEELAAAVGKKLV